MTTVNRELPRLPASAGTARQLVRAHTTTLGVQQREDAAPVALKRRLERFPYVPSDS
jgi:hypothetical protein